MDDRHRASNRQSFLLLFVPGDSVKEGKVFLTVLFSYYIDPSERCLLRCSSKVGRDELSGLS